jgi:hypothetical protein
LECASACGSDDAEAGQDMMAIPPLVLLTAAMGLGLFLGWLYLRRVRRPVLIGTHVLLGASGLGLTLILLRGPPNGTFVPAGSFGMMAAGVLAVAMMSGLAAPLVGKRSRKAANVVLATHAGIGITGFVLFLAWASKL